MLLQSDTDMILILRTFDLLTRESELERSPLPTTRLRLRGDFLGESGSLLLL